MMAALQTAAVASPTRILAFGDSLTAGWTSFSSGPTSPFAPALERALTHEHKLSAVSVTAVGQPGLAAAEAKHGLKRAVGGHDVCLILLGANDLLSSQSQQTMEHTLHALKGLHETCRAAGARSVALGMLDHPALGGARASFNERIALSAGADAFIDPMPMVSASEPQWWSSDGVHLTAAGYEKLGHALAAPLAAVLKARG